MMRAIKGLGSRWAAQIVRLILSAAISIVVIRHLGPSGYGLLAVAGAFVVFFTALLGLPPGPLVVRGLAEGGAERAAELLSTAAALRIIGLVLIIVLSGLAAALSAQSSVIVLAAVFIAVAHAPAVFAVLVSALEFDGRFERVAMLDLGNAATGAVVKTALVFADAPVIWFAAAGIVEGAIMILLYLVASDRRGQIAPWSRFSWPLALSFLRDGWPIMLSGLAVAVYTRTDVIMIAHMIGEKEAGWYTAGVRLVEVLYFFPGVVTSMMLPAMARRHKLDADGYYGLLSTNIGAVLWLSATMALAVTLAAPLVLPTLLGEKFASSVVVAQVAAWTIVFIGVGGALGSSLTIEHATRVPLYSALAGGVINVFLNLLLIPLLGIAGAAVATVCSQAMALVATLIIYGDRRLARALLLALSPVGVVRMVRTLVGRMSGAS